MIPPRVSVILTHQLAINAPYLRLCLQSLLNSKNVPFEVLLMSGAETKPEWVPDLPHFHSIWDPHLNTATLKIQKAMNWISSTSTHILLLSDDVIVSESCISRLYHAFQGRECIIGPMSNSDCSSRYEAHIELGPGPIHLTPDMTMSDFEARHFQELMSFQMSDQITRLLIGCYPWISFFCTMMPKSVWEKVGGLDPQLEYRFNDQDFCTRAGHMGIPTLINFAAFAFHFGSKTLKHLKTETLDREATHHFVQKWNLK